MINLTLIAISIGFLIGFYVGISISFHKTKQISLKTLREMETKIALQKVEDLQRISNVFLWELKRKIYSSNLF